MNLEFFISNVKTLAAVGNNQNVVAVIDWIIEFSNEKGISFGAGQTLLDTTDIQNFIPLSDLTKDLVVQWFITKEGGRDFLDMLCAEHEAIIARNFIVSSASSVALPFIETPAEMQTLMPQPLSTGAQTL
jgi:hypothetical protein